jgi:hypothetical protein
LKYPNQSSSRLVEAGMVGVLLVARQAMPTFHKVLQ